VTFDVILGYVMLGGLIGLGVGLPSPADDRNIE
jgi:hypothetical protein